MCDEKPIEKIKSYVSIIDLVSRYGFELNYKGYICCPFHSEKTPSLKIFADSNRFKCYGCGVGGDVVDLVQNIEKCTRAEAIKKLLDMYGLEDDGEIKYKPIKKQAQIYIKSKTVSTEQKQAIREYVQGCIKDISKTDYFKKRGLATQTIKRFKLGYDIERDSVVIPYNRGLTYYQTRSIVGKKFFKPRTEDAGVEPLFNENALLETPPIFVVESPICAMSITQCGGQAIALCGCSCWNKLANYYKANGKLAPLILCLDNDTAGKEATDKIVLELTKLNCKFCVKNIADECKDPNELLMKDSERLKNNIKEILGEYNNENRNILY